jgi:hypothetical protein
MEQILARLVGDYILQNNWMANTKTKRNFIGQLACLLHVMTYMIPFLFLITNLWQLLLIVVTHYFIDRYRLAVYWIKFYNWNWNSNNYGFPDKTPTFMSVWLMIIIDNVFHLLINYLILSFL